MSIVEKLYEKVGIKPLYNYIGHYPETDENGIILPPVYPEFTCEKQLKIIILLTVGLSMKEFEESLASLVIQLWDKLTSNEKEEIKRILS